MVKKIHAKTGWRIAATLAFSGSLFVTAHTPQRTRADDTVNDTLYSLKHDTDPNLNGLSAGGEMALFGPTPATSGTEPNNPQPGYHDHGRGGNTFVNDPCLDPPAPNRRRTTQSETEIAAFGKDMVIGYNDSYGFYDNTQGLSGFSYSVNGGNTWVDSGGLPPVVKAPNATPFTPGVDGYFGDPVLDVDKAPRTFTVDGQTAAQAAGVFYYSSIYKNNAGVFTIAVNRGTFQTAPPTTPESIADTRCLKDPSQQGVPNTQTLPQRRIVWQPPVQAVPLEDQVSGDFLDKEWLYVNQATGQIYVTYTRFGQDGSTPLELVRSDDGGHTFKGPFVIVPNQNDTFNQATQPMVTASGRVVVTWIARTFAANGTGPESQDRIEEAYSDDQGMTFSSPVVVASVNPQGEPNGYNRGRRSILNAPYIAPQTDGTNVYITYFSGKTPLAVPGGGFTPGPFAKAADILLSTSHDNATTFGPPVKINDDNGATSHVFPSVQVNKNHWVYAGWLDRRNDPANNELTDAWANVSHDGGLTFGHDVEQSDVATSWRVRADARPNFGDYNSSDLLNDNQFLMTWADGRFPPPAPTPQAATPDTIFTIANGLGTGAP